MAKAIKQSEVCSSARVCLGHRRTAYLCCPHFNKSSSSVPFCPSPAQKKICATSLYESVFKSSQNMVLLRASFLVFFASFLGLTSAACPDLWISLGKSCYKVSSDPMNWHQAQQVATLFCWKVIFSFILMFVDIGCCSTVPGRGDTSLRSMMKMSRYDKTINLCL